MVDDVDDVYPLFKFVVISSATVAAGLVDR